MKRVILGLFFASLLSIQASADTGLITVESKHSVQITLDRLTEIMTSKGITIFARVDHAAGAKKIGTKMAPTQLLLFGNPKLGTPLMMSSRTIGIDLPLKALAWRDDNGKVWVSYNDPAFLKSRHEMSDRDPVFEKMRNVLKGLIGKAVSE
ncbi:MAG: DUF302 domain-containing protein [Rhizobiaceae bacterium]